MARGCIAVMLAIGGCRTDGGVADTSTGSSSSSSSTTQAIVETSEGSSSSSSSAIVDGPPEIIDIGGTAISLAEGERTTLTAFVQHPRGDAAVVSGTLLGPGEPAEYGEFVRGIGGRWAVDVGWDDVDAHGDLSFSNAIDIELTVRFVDDAGLVGEALYPLPLRCIPIAPDSCDGSCTDFDSNVDNCGECGRKCMEQQTIGLSTGGCVAGECAPLWSLCVDLHTIGDCNAACAMWGGSQCVEGGCDGHTVLPVPDDSFCSQPPTIAEWPMPDGCDVVPESARARCCCSQ